MENIEDKITELRKKYLANNIDMNSFKSKKDIMFLELAFEVGARTMYNEIENEKSSNENNCDKYNIKKLNPAVILSEYIWKKHPLFNFKIEDGDKICIDQQEQLEYILDIQDFIFKYNKQNKFK